MITHIKTKGLKGQDINEALAQYQIYIGPNGSGKSSRAQAVALATMGYIPWGSSAKKPGDILKAYGPAEGPLTVAVTTGGIELERRFSPTATGASKRLRKNQAKVSDADFAVALAETQTPKVFDLGAFIGLSDQKKIDTLFSIFPPAGDVAALDGAIEETARLISATNKEIGNLEGTIQRLSSSRQELNLPAGTLAEVKAEIEEALKQWREVNDAINQEEIRIAEEAAAEKARLKAEADAKRRTEEDARNKAETNNYARETPQATEPAPVKHEPPVEKPAQAASGIMPTLDKPAPGTPYESLERIAKAMDLSGCTVCAAKLVVKKELAKWRKA